MEKIILKNTYGYKNFISNSTQKLFLDWVRENESLFPNNPQGDNRKFKVITNEDKIFGEVEIIKKSISEIENINSWELEPTYKDYIGINYKNGFIHLHKDESLNHLRWNLILSYPESGGHSIYDNEMNVLEEKMIWRCESGKYVHGSTKVESEKPRITLSLGFLT